MIVGIDLGRNLGWVRGGAVGPIEWGHFTLEDTTDLSAFLRSADGPMRQLVQGCSAIGVEKPDTQGNSYWGIRKNMALLGHLHYWNGFYNKVPIEEISVSTAKLTLAGHGHADKDQMVAAAAEFGCAGMTKDEADALGIWKVMVFGSSAPNKRKPKSSPGRSLKQQGLL